MLRFWRPILLVSFVWLTQGTLRAQPGTLDPSFAEGGRLVLTGVGTAPDVTIDPSGRVLVALRHAGVTCRVARLTSDGSLDDSFGIGGLAPVPFCGEPSLAVANGWIYVAGSDSNFDVFALARLDDTGTLDPAFGSDGVASISVGSPFDAEPRALSVLHDGRVLIAGWRRDESEHPVHSNVLFVTRFLPHGGIDETFASSGIALLDIADGISEEAHAIASLPDGSSLIAGRSGSAGAVVIRLTPHGELDAGFGTDGVTRVPGNAYSSAYDIDVGPDGRITIAGGTGAAVEPDFMLARFLPDGALDQSFGTNGVSAPDIVGHEYGRALLVRPDGRMVVVGRIGQGSTLAFGLIAFTATGHVDTTFGVGGLVMTQFPGATRSAAVAAALDADGKVIATGEAVFSGTNPVRATAARYLGHGVVNGESDPARVGAVLHPPRPNPLSSRSVLGLELPEAAHVRLAIYDAMGRQVTVLRDAMFARGSHEIVWDAVDAAPGVYLVRLSALGQITLRVVSVVR